MRDLRISTLAYIDVFNTSLNEGFSIFGRKCGDFEEVAIWSRGNDSVLPPSLWCFNGLAMFCKCV